MRQIATADDGTGFEVYGDEGSAELIEDGKSIASLGSMRECRETAQSRLVGAQNLLSWRTERD